MRSAIYAIYERRTYHECIHVRYSFFVLYAAHRRKREYQTRLKQWCLRHAKEYRTVHMGGKGGRGDLLPIRGGLKYVRREVKNMATLLEDVHM